MVLSGRYSALCVDCRGAFPHRAEARRCLVHRAACSPLFTHAVLSSHDPRALFTIHATTLSTWEVVFWRTSDRFLRGDGSASKYRVAYCFVYETADAQDQEALTTSDSDEEAVPLSSCPQCGACCPMLRTDTPAEVTAGCWCRAEHVVNGLPISSPRHRGHGIRPICTPGDARTSAPPLRALLWPRYGSP